MTEKPAQSGPTGSIVLDIGEDVGALVVHVDAALLGHEIEVSPLGRDAARVHADVLERRVGAGPAYAVVIAELGAGRYTLWRDATSAWGVVDIVGGAVTEVDWRGPPRMCGG